MAEADGQSLLSTLAAGVQTARARGVRFCDDDDDVKIGDLVRASVPFDVQRVGVGVAAWAGPRTRTTSALRVRMFSNATSSIAQALVKVARRHAGAELLISDARVDVQGEAQLMTFTLGSVDKRVRRALRRHRRRLAV